MKEFKGFKLLLLSIAAVCCLSLGNTYWSSHRFHHAVGTVAASYFDQIQIVPGATGGAPFSSVIQPGTPAIQTVKAAAGNLYSVTCFNVTAAPVYVKLFDVASGSITLGTTNATYQFLCPGNTAGAGFVVNFAVPVAFTNAINYITGLNIGSTDHTAITATSVIVNMVYN